MIDVLLALAGLLGFLLVALSCCGPPGSSKVSFNGNSHDRVETELDRGGSRKITVIEKENINHDVKHPRVPLPSPPLSMYDYALNLFRAASWRSENFVISPFSLGAALAIVQDGAKEETQGELTRLLGKNLSPSDVSLIYSSLTAALSEKSTEVITSVASRFYLDNKINVKSEYQSHIEKAYNTTAMNMNFADGKRCAKDANSYVNETTRGMIPEIATAEDFTDSLGVLINAVYVKGEWKAQFPKSATQSKAFHGIAGDRNEQFMCASARPTLYSLTDKLMVVSLEYKDPAYSLFVMMPSSDYGEWKANLTAIYLHEAMENLTNGKVNLELPKWKIESSTDGKAALEKCGVKRVFDKIADLSGISDEEIRISSIAHKAVIEVNEEGTEAAAACRDVIIFRCPRPDPIDITFNSPFIFCLMRDRYILFIGEYC